MWRSWHLGHHMLSTLNPLLLALTHVPSASFRKASGRASSAVPIIPGNCCPTKGGDRHTPTPTSFGAGSQVGQMSAKSCKLKLCFTWWATRANQSAHVLYVLSMCLNDTRGPPVLRHVLIRSYAAYTLTTKSLNEGLYFLSMKLTLISLSPSTNTAYPCACCPTNSSASTMACASAMLFVGADLPYHLPSPPTHSPWASNSR